MANGGFNKLPEITSKLGQNLMKALDEGATILADETKLSMRGEKHGRYYKVSKTGKPHRASAPGEAPAIDTGALVNSITIASSLSEKFTRMVGTNQEQAEILEFGSPGGKIAPRPFLRPAAIKKKDTVVGRIQKAVKDAIG
jgi:phage gpG-like protein